MDFIMNYKATNITGGHHPVEVLILEPLFWVIFHGPLEAVCLLPISGQRLSWSHDMLHVCRQALSQCVGMTFDRAAEQLGRKGFETDCCTSFCSLKSGSSSLVKESSLWSAIRQFPLQRVRSTSESLWSSSQWCHGANQCSQTLGSLEESAKCTIWRCECR